MSITKDEVLKIAKLAKIALSDKEAESLGQQMAGVIESASLFAKTDLEGIPAQTHGILLSEGMREDVVILSAPREALLKNAPEHDESSFIVPKVLD